MRTLLLSLLTLLLAAGCAAGGALDDASPPSGGSAGSGAMPSDLPTQLTILPLEPVDAGAQVEIVVEARPAGVYRVRFSLPTNSGDPRDAILARTEADTVVSGAVGTVTVLLTAPSTPTTFDVRASVENKVTATTSVTSVEPGSATLIVNPVPLGHRIATTWVATVHEGKTCEQVPGTPPEDGSKQAFAGSSGAPEIHGVKTGVSLAVTLRSGYFMGGCATVDMLPLEAADTPHVVDVQVLDRPVDLAASNVSLSLGVTDPEATWDALLGGANGKALDALDGFPDKARTDVETLLVGMRDALSGTARDKFSSARTAEDWDGLVQAHWGSSTKLTDLVRAWLTAGKAKLMVSEDVLTGRLIPNVESAKPDDADLLLDSIAGIPAEEAGFVSPADVSWNAGPDDMIVLSTHVYFFSSTLATRLAETDVLASYTGATSVSGALAEALDCSALGGELSAAGNDPLLAFSGCAADCLTALCESALEVVWQRAREATGVTPVDIHVAATGKGWVGDAAELAGVTGNWVGQIVNGEEPPTMTGGLLTAAEPPLDAP